VVAATGAAAAESGALTPRTWRGCATPASQKLVTLDVHLIERRPQPARELQSIALSPIATPIAGGISTLSTETGEPPGTPI